MGRRALKPIPPDIDLSWHLLDFEQIAEPCTPETLFDNPGPWEIEVGSGKGLFLQRVSAALPSHNFLGVEIARKYARFSAARLAKSGRANARVLHGDGQRLLRERIPDNALYAVHVYFPDPWWKKRHRKRRVLNERFLSDVVRALAPEGRLHFWTDVQEYYLATLGLIEQASPLTGPHPVEVHAPEHHLDYRTHFERRSRLTGAPVYRAEFRKPN